MHSFISRVVAVAVVLTLAGVVGSGQARAESGVIFKESWYNNYANQQYHYAPSTSKTRIIIKKSEPKFLKRHRADGAKPVLRKKIKLRHYSHSAQPRRRTVHASGYSW